MYIDIQPTQSIDNATRALTEAQIANIPKPVPAPKGFNPMTATDADLVKYGYHPRPSKSSNPKLRATWDNITARSPKFAEVQFKVVDQVHAPLKKNMLDLHEEDPKANTDTSIWSGAIQNPPSGQTFYNVSAKWIVPAAYPPVSAQNSTGGWVDGVYYSYSWVGIDGWGNGKVFQVGTASIVSVVNGKISSTEYWGWHEWYPAGIVAYTNFLVQPGDLVMGWVSSNAGSSTGQVGITNITTNTATPAITLTAPSGIVLSGATAEWIVEDPSGSNFPNYGAEFFFDCIAYSHTANGSQTTEFGLTGATLLDVAGKSTTVGESAGALMTYASNDGP
jgi:hypothetical protein